MAMQADAILFDKDGTLLDFDAFWISLSERSLGAVLARFARQEIPMCELLETLGVHGNAADPNGILCKGTYRQMGEAIHAILCRYGCKASADEVTDAVIAAYNANADAGEVRPTCPALREVLTALRARGKRLAVVTTDTDRVTLRCLQRLGIEDLFDRIYADDGKTPMKPDPFCADDFCRTFGIPKSRVVMVGDTLTDVGFARNAGISVVSLARSEQSRAMLLSVADAVISDLSELSDVLA